MSRATDNAVIELWRVQARLGIRPADRCIPANSNDPDQDAYERTLEAIRKLISGEHHV